MSKTSLSPVESAQDSRGTEVSLAFPHPSNPSRCVAWDGTAFDLGDEKVRVLSYDVSPSGWTDELTRLHEEVAGSDHFIDVASRNHALKEVERSLSRTPSVVLEVGVSSGFLLRELQSRLKEHIVIGADYTRGTLDALGKQLADIPLLQFDLIRCGLPESFVDVVVALNVLEHIDDHASAVSELFRILRPGGMAIIEVPAGPSLYDIYDRALMHYRRYAMAELVALFERAGFTIKRTSHLGFVLYPAFYVSKRVNQLHYRKSDVLSDQEAVSHMIVATRKSNRLGSLALRFEELFRPYLPYPCGVRCLLSAIKPASRH